MVDVVTLTCPIDACENSCTAGQAMCKTCWRQVPRSLQREVYAAWTSRLAQPSAAARRRHLQAVENAEAAVERREPRPLFGPVDVDEVIL